MANLQIFSSLVNSDFEGLDPQKIETELLGEVSLPANDQKEILESFTRQLRDFETRTGVVLPGIADGGMKKASSEASRPAATSFNFTPTPQRVAPPASSFTSFGGGEAPPSRDDDDEEDDDEEDDEDDDDEDDEDEAPTGSKRFGEAAHRLKLEPLNENIGQRDRMSMEEMIMDIDIFRHHLTEQGDDIKNIKEVDPAVTSYAEVKRIHNLLSVLYASRHYTTLFEDIVLSGTRLLETVFDGSLKVLGKYPISYVGLTKTLNTKFRSNGKAVANAATKVANKYGFTPEKIIMLDLMMPFITVPIKNAQNDAGLVTNRNVANALGGY